MPYTRPKAKKKLSAEEILANAIAEVSADYIASHCPFKVGDKVTAHGIHSIPNQRVCTITKLTTCIQPCVTTPKVSIFATLNNESVVGVEYLEKMADYVKVRGVVDIRIQISTENGTLTKERLNGMNYFATQLEVATEIPTNEYTRSKAIETIKDIATNKAMECFKNMCTAMSALPRIALTEIMDCTIWENGDLCIY